MTHGSLFSGIGGFDLAAQWMGWENVFHVERDEFCRQVLNHHFPESQSFDDVKTFDATPFRGRLSVLSGGFPCQPFSAAGKRAGTSDDRYLWPEMFRIIREARPTYVVAENVRGLLSWNEGLVLDTVCADLEGEGYEVQTFVLPASAVNAPHQRYRCWIVAYANNTGDRTSRSRTDKNRQKEVKRWEEQPQSEPSRYSENVADSNSGMRRGGRAISESRENKKRRLHSKKEKQTSHDLRSKTVGCDPMGRETKDVANSDSERQQEQRRAESIQQEKSRQAERFRLERQSWWSVEPSVGRVAHGIPNRVDRLKGLGNAIVPQIAMQIGLTIKAVRDA